MGQAEKRSYLDDWTVFFWKHEMQQTTRSGSALSLQTEQQLDKTRLLRCELQSLTKEICWNEQAYLTWYFMLI